MGGHDFFLGMSYGAAALAIVVELIALKVARSRAWKLVEEEKDLEAQD